MTLFACVISCCLHVLPIAAPQQGDAPKEEYSPFVAAASEEAQQSVASLQLAEGLSATLFAAEPLLANPVCLYVADDGAIYVAETFRHHAGVTDMREHMGWLDDDLASRSVQDRVAMIAKYEGDNFSMYSKDQDRVRVIRDEDGDHVADKSTVFADGFNKPSAGIGAGLLVHNGDVYYTCIPDLWLLRDRDGDDRAEDKQVLSTGYGINIALLGHDLHGLRIGPDMRLYFSSGDRGFRVETEEGVLNSPKTGAVLRCNLDGTHLEIVHDGLRNPQELVFDQWGNLWTGDNNSDGGDRARWVNIVPGGDSGWRYPYQWIQSPNSRGPWSDEKMWHPFHPGQPAFLVPPVANLADGPSGLTYYPGTGLGQHWDQHFFLADFRGGRSYSGIHSFTVQPKGAFFELGQPEKFVWNTLVTDCDFGPDGAMYLTDWVSGWNKTGKGRIYRVTDESQDQDPDRLSTLGLLSAGFEQRSAEELRALLSHPDMRVRLGAEFQLATTGSGGIRTLAAEAYDSNNLLARLHGIWGLGIAARTEPAVLPSIVGLLHDQAPEVRAQALRVLGEEGDESYAEDLVALLSDENPRVRFFAALAAKRLRPHSAVEPLRQLLLDAGTRDPNLRHAGVMGLWGTANETDLERLAQDPSSDVRMAVLLVRRRQGATSIQEFLDDPEPLLVMEAARAIHDVPIEGALEALARLPIKEGAPNGLVRRVMNANFRLGGEEQARRLAALSKRRDLADVNRIEGLSMLRSWAEPEARDRVINFWRPLPQDRDVSFLADLAAEWGASLKENSPRVQEAWAQLVAVAPSPIALERLLEIVADSEAPSAVRVAAVQTLQDSHSPLLKSAVDLALSAPQGELRAVGLTALADLSPQDALPRLEGVLENGELTEQRAAYRLLAGTHDDRAAELLSNALRSFLENTAPEELRLDLLLAAEENADPHLVSLLQAAHVSDSEEDPLQPYLPSLFGGDASKGRAVFERADLSCLRCHAIDDAAGNTVGPDLRGLSQRLSRRRMLQAILWPNARTTAGYDATVLFFLDGTSLSGRVLEEGLVLEGEEGTWLRLQDSDGKLHEVCEEDIEERRPDLSAMPEDLGRLIDRRAMRDLLAFLSSL